MPLSLFEGRPALEYFSESSAGVILPPPESFLDGNSTLQPLACASGSWLHRCHIHLNMSCCGGINCWIALDAMHWGHSMCTLLSCCLCGLGPGGCLRIKTQLNCLFLLAPNNKYKLSLWYLFYELFKVNILLKKKNKSQPNDSTESFTEQLFLSLRTILTRLLLSLWHLWHRH